MLRVPFDERIECLLFLLAGLAPDPFNECLFLQLRVSLQPVGPYIIKGVRTRGIDIAFLVSGKAREICIH